MQALLVQKQTGVKAASAEEIEEFNKFCEDTKTTMFKVCVTDDEHDVLSLDANTPFIASDNGRLYNNVMEGYNEIMLENTVTQFEHDQPNTKYNHEIMFTLISDKFSFNSEAKQVLMNTKDYDGIYYKTDNDNYWGSRVPEFDGQNVAGQMMAELRNSYN